MSTDLRTITLNLTRREAEITREALTVIARDYRGDDTYHDGFMKELAAIDRRLFIAMKNDIT